MARTRRSCDRGREFRVASAALRNCQRPGRTSGTLKCSIGTWHDPVDTHLEHITGFGALDVDWACQRVGAAARKVGAQFLDLFDGRPRDHLIVRMHHRLEDDRIAGSDVQDGRLGVVEPAPLRRFHRRGQKMNFAGVALRRDGPQLLLVRRRRRRERYDGGSGGTEWREGRERGLAPELGRGRESETVVLRRRRP